MCKQFSEPHGNKRKRRKTKRQRPQQSRLGRKRRLMGGGGGGGAGAGATGRRTGPRGRDGAGGDGSRAGPRARGQPRKTSGHSRLCTCATRRRRTIGEEPEGPSEPLSSQGTTEPGSQGGGWPKVTPPGLGGTLLRAPSLGPPSLLFVMFSRLPRCPFWRCCGHIPPRSRRAHSTLTRRRRPHEAMWRQHGRRSATLRCELGLLLRELRGSPHTGSLVTAR